MLLITGARLGDMFGYRLVFVAGLSIFTAASLVCGLAPNAIVLIAARIVQGSGAALMVPQVLTGIQLNFSGEERTRAIGMYAVALSTGAVAGQVLGGVLISANVFDSGWRPIFLINLPIGIAMVAAAYRYLPVHDGATQKQLDVAGVITLSAGVLLLVLPLILGHTQNWPEWTWICLAASVVPLTAFVFVERSISQQNGDPLINLHIAARPEIGLALASYGGALMTYFSLLFVLAIYLQEGLGKSALVSGMALVSWVAAYGIGGPVVPRVPVRHTRFIASFGYCLLAASYLAISLSVVFDALNGVVLFVLLGFGGLGLGIGVTANIRQMTGAVPAEFAPDLSGMITTTAQTSGVIGIATFGTAYFSFASKPGAVVASHAFATVTAAFSVATLFAALAAYRSANAASIGSPKTELDPIPHRPRGRRMSDRVSITADK
jgi:hypothetical protein